MKRVLTYGTFDLFHTGHLNLLKRAKGFGDYLIVGLSTDEFNRIKGKKTLIPFEERREIIKSICYVDEVIPEESWDQKEKDIKKLNIETFVMGDDWKGEFDYLKKLCEVIYVPRTKHISTTQIKENLKSFYNIDVERLKESIETVNAIVKVLE